MIFPFQDNFFIPVSGAGDIGGVRLNTDRFFQLSFVFLPIDNIDPIFLILKRDRLEFLFGLLVGTVFAELPLLVLADLLFPVVVDLLVVVDYFGVGFFQLAFENSVGKLVLLKLLQLASLPLEILVADFDGIGEQPLPKLMNVFETYLSNCLPTRTSFLFKS